MPNQHDILTGSQPDGRAYTDAMDHTCNNWTSNATGMGSAQLGHSDKQGGGNGSWNSTHREPRLQPAEPGGHRRRGSAVLLRRELSQERSGGMGRRGGIGRGTPALRNPPVLPLPLPLPSF